MAFPPPEPHHSNVADTSEMRPPPSENSSTEQYLAPVHANHQQDQTATALNQSTPRNHASESSLNGTIGSESTKVSTDQPRGKKSSAALSQASSIPGAPVTLSEHGSEDDTADENAGFEPIKTTKSKRPISADLESTMSRKLMENDLFKVLSRRRTSTSVRPDSVITGSGDPEEQAEIERLMSRMFGKTRQEHSEDEKTRHVGLVFKNLTVKGMGLGAALQGTLGDPFMRLPRLFKSLVSRGAKGATSKSPVRTILDDFTGSIRPGEMLLVLGRPGSGCSTFLKVLANQRFGYVSVDGDVSYGGTDAKTMGKNYRGEIVYNPEDDLHYATLSVKRTLSFALKTRTPGKASRNEGESRAEYVKEFLRVVAKLFWIEHTSSYHGWKESL